MSRIDFDTVGGGENGVLNQLIISSSMGFSLMSTREIVYKNVLTA
jgi:hypothetical protein